MKSLSTKWKRILLIVAGMGALSTLTFNCAPSMFQSAKGGFGSFSSFDIFSAPRNSPYALMTAKQTYKTMLNVTGQEGAQTAAQLAEYESRASTMSTNDRLTNVSAPLQMAATSLAGEVCNGLLTKEVALTQDARKFFGQVNFGAAVSANSKGAYDSAINAMANSFWGRAPSSDEASALDSFYTEFSAGAGTAAAGTRNLYLAACTGMLASLDTYNY